MALLTERTPTLVCQPVGPPPSSLHLTPLADEISALLETMQGRIYRTFWQVERVITSLFELVDDRVPVHRSVGEDRQQEEIEMPFQRLSSHT